MSSFEILRSRWGRRRWRVLLRGNNGEVLMHSEHLNSKEACHTNIAAVRHAVLTAEIEDKSQDRGQ